MEVYILDNLRRPIDVVDRFESFIWTERYAAMGDFELALMSNSSNRRRFAVGTRISTTESLRLMEVETLEDKDTDGEKILTIRGRSLEKILDDRIARPSTADLTVSPKWVLTGLPAVIARKLFHDICVLGVLDPGDIIPGVIEASIFPEDTIPEPTDTITVEMEPDTLYKNMVDLCNIYDLGFRLVQDPNTWQLYWDVYSGSDRTTAQSDLPPVIFSPDLDNLKNPTELTSNALVKNVAFVLSSVGHEWVYPSDVNPSISGFERRVLLVKADDIQDEDPLVASARMIQKGREELAKCRSFAGFDGEITQNSQYKYGRDYNLGDLVEQRNTDGVTNYMRVVEQIIVQDREGERSYPTLSINKFIMPGSWASWDFNQEWVDLGPETWVDV